MSEPTAEELAQARALMDADPDVQRAIEQLRHPSAATPDADDASVCRCQIIGWSRDPVEPHIPAQAEWEQVDDCPAHPFRGPLREAGR